MHIIGWYLLYGLNEKENSNVGGNVLWTICLTTTLIIWFRTTNILVIWVPEQGNSFRSIARNTRARIILEKFICQIVSNGDRTWKLLVQRANWFATEVVEIHAQYQYYFYRILRFSRLLCIGELFCQLISFLRRPVY